MNKLATLVSVFSSAVLGGMVNAAVINFDEIGVAGSVYPYYTQAGFVSQGFAFSTNMDVIDVSPNGGWSSGVGSGHSGNYAALNDYGGSMLMTQVGGGSFSVADLWLNGWQGSTTTSSIEGYLNGALVGSVVATYGSPWSDITLNFAAIDTLKINGGIFLVDDISVNGGNGQVPEPATLSLLALGLLGATLVARRSKA